MTARLDDHRQASARRSQLVFLAKRSVVSCEQACLTIRLIDAVKH